MEREAVIFVSEGVELGVCLIGKIRIVLLDKEVLSGIRLAVIRRCLLEAEVSGGVVGFGPWSTYHGLHGKLRGARILISSRHS